jgi:hypothetical protein
MMIKGEERERGSKVDPFLSVAWWIVVITWVQTHELGSSLGRSYQSIALCSPFSQVLQQPHHQDSLLQLQNLTKDLLQP